MGVDLGIENLGDVELIGQGGFSSVYAASHTLLKRPVAVKVLNTLTKDSERRRFERECEVLGRLSDHPNVVTVYGAGYTSDNHPYLIMELVRGGTLADLLEQRHQVEWVEAVGYLVPVVEALGRAHQESILHRDVKPENILLADDEPRLADFGIAYLRDATGATSTHITASWLHTPPETFDNKRDERSDLYSAASTLYNLIAGQAPFWRATDDSLNPLMARLLYEQPPDLPSELAPAALNGFIQRSLAKDPDQRPQTAAQFVAELNELTEVAVGARMARPQPRPEPLAPTQPASQAFAPPPDVGKRAKTQYTPPTAVAGVSAAPGFAPPPPAPFIPPEPAGRGVVAVNGEVSGGQRALVTIAALVALVGVATFFFDVGLFEYGRAEAIIANTVSIPVLLATALAGLLARRRSTVGGVAFAAGVGLLTFDLSREFRLIFDYGLVPLGVTAVACAVLIIVGLVLLSSEPSLGANRVVPLILIGLVICGGTFFTYRDYFGGWSTTVVFMVGVALVTGASIMARGGALPVTAGIYGLVLTITFFRVVSSIPRVLTNDRAALALVLGFLGWTIIGLTRLGGRAASPSPEAISSGGR